MATPDYSKIWGANSPLAKYEFTEADYLRGWEFIGSMPPARTMFDAWMRKADEKMRWLYDNAFSENSLGGFLFWRLPDTAYFVGEKRALQDGPLDVYLECTIAGRTSKEQMKKLPQGAEIGKTFVDGTATWLVRQFATNAALADHRTRTPLDHPDGSVLKKHLGFEVYDKGETDARLNVKANANHGYHVPAPEAANNTRFLRNDNTWQTVTAGNIGAYTKGETYTKSEIDSRVNGKVSKSGDTMTGALMFSNNIGECVRGVMADSDTWRIYAHQDGASNKGYLAIDLGDDGDEALYVRQFSGPFTTQVRFAKILGSDGTTMFPVSVTSQSFYANNWFRALGDTGLHFESYGGGWHMTDDKWIRAWNGKNVYTSGVIRCDAGFEGYLRGTADNANGLQGKDVNHFYRHLGGRETPTLVPLVDWERMKQENGGQDVRNINNPAAGIVAYGGDALFGQKYSKGTILLKQSYKNFDKILVCCSNDNGDYSYNTLWDKWEMEFMFANAYKFDIAISKHCYWQIFGNKRGSSNAPLSTETLWRGSVQDCGLIEIYGVYY